MKKQIVLFIGLIFSLSLVGSAQTKTVTNADLEKFRQKRLQAERDYRENYERMGFPSPEELERQREKDRIKREELSERFRNERLERQAIEAQQEQNRRFQQQNQNLQNYPNDGYYNNFLYGTTSYFGGRNYPQYRRFTRRYNQNYPISGFFTVNQLMKIQRGSQQYGFANPSFRVRTPQAGIKINIGGGTRR